MHLSRAGIEEGLDVVAKLRSAHNRIVAEHNSLAFEQRGVRNQLHAGNEIAARLVAGGKAARPCGGVFEHRATIRHSVAFRITESASDSGIGDTANTVGLGLVLAPHSLTDRLAHRLHVDAVVGTRGEAVINPKERTDLLPVRRFLKHFHAVGTQANDFAGSEIADNGISEILKRAALARDSITVIIASDNDRGASEIVAGRDDAVLSQDNHRTRALDFTENEIDPLDKIRPHVYHQGHYLGLVDIVCRQFAKVHFLLKKLVGKSAKVADFGNGGYRVTAEM